MRKMTERRQRFDHLIGVDRCRVIYRYGDGSVLTESFDEKTEALAKATAGSGLPPSGWERPESVEIYLGRFVAVGSTDCKWTDEHRLAVGVPSDGGGINWSSGDVDDSLSGQLAMFGGVS